MSDEHVLIAKGQPVGTIRFRVPNVREMGQIVVAAHKATKAAFGDEDAKGTQAYEELYEQKKGVLLLQAVCRQPQDDIFPVFVTADEVQEQLNDDEAGSALAHYNVFKRESSPVSQEASQEECAAWYERLGRAKVRSRLPLARCSAEALQDLVMYAVDVLYPEPPPVIVADTEPPPADAAEPTEGA